MNRRIVLVLSLGLIGLAAAANSAHAQSQSSQPAPAAQPAPANSASPQSSGQDSSATPAAAPLKKIWTNEDMGKSQGQPAISTFKSADSKNANAAAKPHPAHPHDPAWYRDQIVRLQGQVAQLDKQIAELQAAIDGKPTGDAIKSTRPAGVKWDSWEHELADAKQKREDLLDKISALHDQARHDGVNPNQLP